MTSFNLIFAEMRNYLSGNTSFYFILLLPSLLFNIKDFLERSDSL